MGAAPTMLFCAGATKAGTSWLYEYLRDHPETSLRTIKELHYFDRLHKGNLKGHVRDLDKEIARLATELEIGTAKWPLWTARQHADRLAYRAVLVSKAAPPQAYLDYVIEGANGKRLVGELTPEYGLVPVDRLCEMNALAPDVRWVFLMRDPVTRLRSHVRMLVKRAGTTHDAFAEACEAKFEDVLAGRAEDVTQRGDYAAIHGRLASVAGPDKLLAMFYEHLMTSDGVARVTGFLGLSNLPAKTNKKVHEGIAVPMPPVLRAQARDWLMPQYDFVARTFGLPSDWESVPELKDKVA